MMLIRYNSSMSSQYQFLNHGAQDQTLCSSAQASNGKIRGESLSKLSEKLKSFNNAALTTRMDLINISFEEFQTASPYGQLMQEKNLKDTLINFANSFDTVNVTQHF